MVRISERTRVYLVGFSMTVVGCVLFLIGFATPNWIEAHFARYGRVTFKSAVGLWQTCIATTSIAVDLCSTIGVDGGSVVHHIVQGLECIALVTLVGFGVTAILHNFTGATASNVDCFNSLVSFLGISGGIFGIIGAVVFVTNYNMMPPSWSFGLVLAGCVVVITGAVMMACSASQLSTRSTRGRGVVYQTSQYPQYPMEFGQPQIHVVSMSNQWGQNGFFPAVPQACYSAPAIT